FLAGLAIFPAVFTYGLEPEARPGLFLVVLPAVFNHIPFGPFFLLLFLLLFLFATFTSVFSMFLFIFSSLTHAPAFNRTNSTCIRIFKIRNYRCSCHERRCLQAK